MSSGNRWQEFFDNHAPIYMDNVFTRNTLAEVDFILEELKLAPGSHVLDVGCGTGRHTVELARRGYQMTGLDISEGMLVQARQAAEVAGVAVTWVQADATHFTVKRQYDAAICLCEGAFSLINVDEDPIGHDLAILKNIYAALKPGAGFILTAPLAFQYVRKITQADVENEVFDPINMVETLTMDWKTPAGDKREVLVRQRVYVPSELAMLFRLAGLQVRSIWGGTAGNWGRRPIDLDEIEMMVVAAKTTVDPDEWWEKMRQSDTA